jgi:predicted dienelactone hydrolase
MRAVLSLICGVVAAWAGFMPGAAAAPVNLTVGWLEVAAWLPESSTPGPWPLLVFSHGFDGCNTQITFLMEALAKGGYAVFAPNHRDSSCAAMMWPTRPEAPFGEVSEWSDATFRDRRNDIKRLLDGLASDPHYRSAPFDWQHVGLVGYSLGGYTVLGVAGAWGSWKDGRVKAVLALAPYTAPFVEQDTLGGLAAPVMYQGGTRDTGATPYVMKAGGAYDRSPAPKYFVEFEGAGHYAWTNLNETMQEPIIEYALAFFDRCFKGKDFPKRLLQRHGNVAAVEASE